MRTPSRATLATWGAIAGLVEGMVASFVVGLNIGVPGTFVFVGLAVGRTFDEAASGQ